MGNITGTLNLWPAIVSTFYCAMLFCLKSIAISTNIYCVPTYLHGIEYKEIYGQNGLMK